MTTKSNASLQIIRPQWMVLSGRLVMNSEAKSLQSHFNIVNAAYEKMQASYAGAALLQLLVTNPWLQSATIGFKPSSEHDDEGGSYRSISLRFRNVQCVPNVELPIELLDAEDYLYDQWFNDDMHSEVYSCLMGCGDYSDITLLLDRSKVVDLLADLSEVSGLAAFRALLNEHLYRIGEKPIKTESLEATPA